MTLADLRERGVNLVIGHPTLIPSGALSGPHAGLHARWARDMLGYSQEPLGWVRLVGMPVPGGELLLWYLTPTPALDAVIRAHGWDEATLDAGD